MKIQKLVVGKGKTTRPSDAEEWEKEYYEIEVAIEDLSELEVTKANITGLIDGWLSTPKPSAKVPAKIPQLDADELAQLPWKTYRTKQSCKPDGAGWVFCNTPGAGALVDLIEKQGKNVRVQIGQHTFEVRFSGAENQFIGRSPIKEEYSGGLAA